MLNLILSQGLSPNQFYLLYNMREGIVTQFINVEQELRALETNNWIKKGFSVFSLEKKAEKLIDEVDKYFKVQKKKTNEELMGKEFAMNLQKYQELFPKKRIPSGKVARATDSVVEASFRWFFENHDYSWETILKAASVYVDEFEKKKYEFMRTSAYFIRKTERDKSIISELADYCSIVESGEDISDTHFSEKVV